MQIIAIYDRPEAESAGSHVEAMMAVNDDEAPHVMRRLLPLVTKLGWSIRQHNSNTETEVLYYLAGEQNEDD